MTILNLCYCYLFTAHRAQKTQSIAKRIVLKLLTKILSQHLACKIPFEKCFSNLLQIPGWKLCRIISHCAIEDFLNAEWKRKKMNKWIYLVNEELCFNTESQTEIFAIRVECTWTSQWIIIELVSLDARAAIVKYCVSVWLRIQFLLYVLRFVYMFSFALKNECYKQYFTLNSSTVYCSKTLCVRQPYIQ